VAIFDDVVAEMRVQAGQGQFDLSLVANTLPPPPVELLPTPDARPSFETAYQSAMLASEPAERTALLRALSGSLASRADDPGWAAPLRRRVTAALAAEVKTDRAYRELTQSSVKSARGLAARADVTGLQAVIARALRTDDRLGGRRPGEMAALLAALDVE